MPLVASRITHLRVSSATLCLATTEIEPAVMSMTLGARDETRDETRDWFAWKHTTTHPCPLS